MKDKIRRSNITATWIVAILQHRNSRGIKFLCLKNWSNIRWQSEHNIHHTSGTLIVKRDKWISTALLLAHSRCLWLHGHVSVHVSYLISIDSKWCSKGPYKRISIKESVTAVLHSNMYNYLCSRLRKQHQICTKHTSLQLKETSGIFQL